MKTALPAYLQKSNENSYAAKQVQRINAESALAKGSNNRTYAASTRGGGPPPPVRSKVPKLALNAVDSKKKKNASASQSARAADASNKIGHHAPQAIPSGAVQQETEELPDIQTPAGSQSARASLPDDIPFDFSSFTAGGHAIFDGSSAPIGIDNGINRLTDIGEGQFGTLASNIDNVDAMAAAIEGRAHASANAGFSALHVVGTITDPAHGSNSEQAQTQKGQSSQQPAAPINLGGYGGGAGLSIVGASMSERPDTRRSRQRNRGGDGGNAAPARPGSAVGGMHMERSKPVGDYQNNSAGNAVDESITGLGNPLLNPAHNPNAAIAKPAPEAPQVPQRSNVRGGGRAGRNVVDPSQTSA
eukprot:GSChrysophyteH1.ASY1.ANO1.2979.1 assembled CDS